MTTVAEFPLRTRTSEAWARSMAGESAALLADQAFLERKAAANAFELMQRWPEPSAPDDWCITLAGVARDETLHLHQVLKLLRARGVALPRSHQNPYAQELRTVVRLGEGNAELVDRLLVAGLIEARSCERFEVLAPQCADEEVARFWAGLEASERGHHAAFVRLASYVQPATVVAARWAELAELEAAVLARQSGGARIHAGER